ncbi:MAG: SIMPL domain-containing protein [Azoarcus sp.]|jgi:hypothetical protein|nr:SIMPL domain-containing protein [Azoarcus sp.]
MTCERSDNCKCKVVAIFLIFIGIALSGFFPGYFYYKAKMDSNFVTVKGLAEMDVKADLAILDLKFVVANNDLLTAKSEVDKNLKVISEFLKQKGFADNEIMPGRMDTVDMLTNVYGGEVKNVQRYILSQVVTVESQQVLLVEKTLSAMGELVAKGVVLDGRNNMSPVAYVFTKLNEVKPEMLRQATKNAFEAAEEFAKSSNSKVGKIRMASQGVFSVMPRTQTRQYQEESQSIEKKVRVVSTVEYFLE